MATLQDLANSISTFEGFPIPGSVAQRNNNPGNLKYVGQAGAIGKDSQGFAIFGSVADGQAALVNQLGLYADRGLTLSQMMNIYAPSSENDTSNYLNYVSNQTGIAPDASLSSFRVG